MNLFGDVQILVIVLKFFINMKHVLLCSRTDSLSFEGQVGGGGSKKFFATLPFPISYLVRGETRPRTHAPTTLCIIQQPGDSINRLIKSETYAPRPPRGTVKPSSTVATIKKHRNNPPRRFTRELTRTCGPSALWPAPRQRKIVRHATTPSYILFLSSTSVNITMIQSGKVSTKENLRLE